MAEAWLPGAGRLHSKHNGGSLKGGAPRAVWHTSENDPRTISARSIAQRLEQRGHNAHVVWNPLSGEIVQMVPATRAARLLGDVGREGRACLQIVVVGFAGEPFTAGPLEGLDDILGWLDSWHVARRWPAGDPLPCPEAYQARRDRRPWARGGHFGSSQVPLTRDPSPGAIDTRKITGPEEPVGIPRPRMAPGATAGLPDPDGLLPHPMAAPGELSASLPAPVRANSRP